LAARHSVQQRDRTGACYEECLRESTRNNDIGSMTLGPAAHDMTTPRRNDDVHDDDDDDDDDTKNK